MTEQKAKDGAFMILRNEKGEILLQKDQRTPPKFNIPGGGPDDGEAPINAAIRETWEEVGLTIKKDRVLFVGEFQLRLNGTSVFLYFYDAVVETLPVHQSDEVGEQRWFDPEEILRLPVEEVYRAQQGMVRHFLQWEEDGRKESSCKRDFLVAPFDRKDGKYFEGL